MNGELMNALMQVIDTQDSRTMPNRQPRTKGTLRIEQVRLQRTNFQLSYFESLYAHIWT